MNVENLVDINVDIPVVLSDEAAQLVVYHHPKNIYNKLQTFFYTNLLSKQHFGLVWKDFFAELRSCIIFYAAPAQGKHFDAAPAPTLPDMRNKQRS
jgi:hypothetical protein